MTSGYTLARSSEAFFAPLTKQQIMDTTSPCQFTPEVCAQLKFYVYRLIDPRSGETFYVGKGKNNRVFAHALVAQSLAEDADYARLSDTLARIREIQSEGLQVQHVIHRYGLDEATAFHVESALIDAYTDLTNQVLGHGSSSSGAMPTNELLLRYQAEVASFHHRCVLISVNQSGDRGDFYTRTRFAWKLSRKRVEKAELVLSVENGLIVDVFVAHQWMPVTPKDFPVTVPVKGRYGFVGVRAPDEMLKLYTQKRVPPEYRKTGAANPIKYTFKG